MLDKLKIISRDSARAEEILTINFLYSDNPIHLRLILFCSANTNEFGILMMINYGITFSLQLDETKDQR